MALRLCALQVVASAVAGVAFLAQSWHAALAAVAGGLLVALGNALLAKRAFAGVSGASLALARLWYGMVLRWVVIGAGLVAILGYYKLPPLAALVGLVAAYAVHLLAFRFKG